MIRKVAVLALFSVVAPAQDPTSRLVEVKNFDAERGAHAAKVLNNLFHTHIMATYDDVLSVITLRGTPEAVASAEKLLAKFDQMQQPAAPARAAARQVYVTMYLVEASPTGTAGGPLPDPIESSVKQLRSTFAAFKAYRLLDTLQTASMPGKKVELSTALPMASDLPPALIHVGYTAEPGREGAVQVGGFKFSVRLPVGTASGQPNFISTGINTDISIAPNQKVVLGKIAGLEPGSSMFVIVTARSE